MIRSSLKYILQVSQHFMDKIFSIIMLGSMSNMRWMNYKSIVKMIDYFDYKINHVCGKEHRNTSVDTTAIFICSLPQTWLILLSK